MPVRLLACAAILAMAINLNDDGSVCRAADILTASTVRTVALSGQVPTGSPSVPAFSRFGGLTISATGQVAFRSSHQGPNVSDANNEMMWMERGGGLRLVAREAGFAPPPNDTRRFFTLAGPQWLHDGEIAMHGALNSSLDLSAAWKTSGTELQQVGGPGFPVLNVDGAPLSSFSWRQVDVAAAYSSQLMLLGGLARHTNGVDNLGGFWLAKDGHLRPFALLGQQAPGAPPGANFSSVWSPVLNRHGHIALQGELNGAIFGNNLDDGIWTNRGGSLDILARAGGPASEFGPDFSYVLFPRHNVSINDAGAVVYNAYAGGPAGPDVSGLVLDDGATRRVVVRVGDPAPGSRPDLSFSRLDIGASAVNGQGQVAFSATVNPELGAREPYGIWFERAQGELVAIARGGDPAPGGGVFGLDRHQPFAMNSAGQIAFGSELREIGQEGIWATDRQGDLQLIARTGSQIEVAPGDVRTISAITFEHTVSFEVTTGGQDGLTSSLNDKGQLVFAAFFTDGSQGLFVSNAVAVPEPTSTAGSLIAIIAAALGRRSRNLR
jgi:hypothetical protein